MNTENPSELKYDKANRTIVAKKLSNEQFYFDTLKKIARKYQTAEQLRRRGGQYGLDADEEIEMAYENIQAEAENAIRGKRRPKS